MNRIDGRQLELIKRYVDPKYYDTKKLLSYLQMHEKVGNEVFSYIYKGGWNGSGKKPYSTLLETDAGYQPLQVSQFIDKIPFFFYHFGENEKEDFGSLDDLFDEYKSILHYWDIDAIKAMYCDLEYLFYEKQFSLNEIFNYCRRQAGRVGGGYFKHWVDFVKRCDQLGITDYMPDCFITSYNRVLEKMGEKPIIYGVLTMEEFDVKNYFDRSKLELVFNGVFPYDANGKPIMEYINLDIKNAQEVWCEMDKSKFGKLFVKLTPTTTIDLLAYDHLTGGKRKIRRLYTGPQKMKFNKEALKMARKQANLTQKEVAIAIDANERTYQKWEGGETTPDGYYLLKLINWLDIRDPLSLIIEE